MTMNRRSLIGVEAGVLADGGLWWLIAWAAGLHGWWLAIPLAGILLCGLPSGIIGGWLANGRKPV